MFIIKAKKANLDAIPCGTILPWENAPIPDGYLRCDGSTYTKFEFPELFAAIKSCYGGSNQILQVPNLEETAYKEPTCPHPICDII